MFLHFFSNLGIDFGQTFNLEVEVFIVLSITFTKEITFLSNSLGVFDKKNNILAKLFFRIFMITVLFIFKSKC